MAMRLPLIPPDQLTPEQRTLYDRSREQILHGVHVVQDNARGRRAAWALGSAPT